MNDIKVTEFTEENRYANSFQMRIKSGTAFEWDPLSPGETNIFKSYQRSDPDISGNNHVTYLIRFGGNNHALNDANLQFVVKYFNGNNFITIERSFTLLFYKVLQVMIVPL